MKLNRRKKEKEPTIGGLLKDTFRLIAAKGYNAMPGVRVIYPETIKSVKRSIEKEDIPEIVRDLKTLKKERKKYRGEMRKAIEESIVEAERRKQEHIKELRKLKKQLEKFPHLRKKNSNSLLNMNMKKAKQIIKNGVVDKLARIVRKKARQAQIHQADKYMAAKNKLEEAKRKLEILRSTSKRNIEFLGKVERKAKALEDKAQTSKLIKYGVPAAATTTAASVVAALAARKKLKEERELAKAKALEAAQAQAQQPPTIRLVISPRANSKKDLTKNSPLTVAKLARLGTIAAIGHKMAKHADIGLKHYASFRKQVKKLPEFKMAAKAVKETAKVAKKAAKVAKKGAKYAPDAATIAAATTAGGLAGYQTGKFDLNKYREKKAKEYFKKLQAEKDAYEFDRERLRKKGYLRPYTPANNAKDITLNLAKKRKPSKDPRQQKLPLGDSPKAAKPAARVAPKPRPTVAPPPKAAPALKSPGKLAGKAAVAASLIGALAGAIQKYREQQAHPQSPARKQEAIDLYRKMQMDKYARKQGLDRAEDYIRYLKAKRRDDAYYSAFDNSKDAKAKKVTKNFAFIPALRLAAAVRSAPVVAKLAGRVGSVLGKAGSKIGTGLKKAWKFSNKPAMTTASNLAVAGAFMAPTVSEMAKQPKGRKNSKKKKKK